ncbi:MAG TPA: hypothetical protein VL485_24330 [Ktedonobacteraceae bacterium]|jgi:hypothetical protein|nr:hypothetical protein [Ktedonobacteraceae bacterium]
MNRLCMPYQYSREDDPKPDPLPDTPQPEPLPDTPQPEPLPDTPQPGNVLFSSGDML